MWIFSSHSFPRPQLRFIKPMISFLVFKERAASLAPNTTITAFDLIHPFTRTSPQPLDNFHLLGFGNTLFLNDNSGFISYLIFWFELQKKNNFVSCVPDSLCIPYIYNRQ